MPEVPAVEMTLAAYYFRVPGVPNTERTEYYCIEYLEYNLLKRLSTREYLGYRLLIRLSTREYLKYQLLKWPWPSNTVVSTWGTKH